MNNRKIIIPREAVIDIFQTSGRTDARVAFPVQDCITRMSTEFLEEMFKQGAKLAKARSQQGKPITLEPKDIELALSFMYDTQLYTSTNTLQSCISTAEVKRRKRARAAVLEDDQILSGPALHLERLQNIQNQVLRAKPKKQKQ